MSRKVSNIISLLLSAVLALLALVSWPLAHQYFTTNVLVTGTGLDEEGARRLIGQDNGIVFIDEIEIPMSSTIGYDAYDTNLALDDFNIVNEIRQENGIQPLKWNNSLVRASTIRAQESSQKWSHIRPNGQAYWTVDSKHVYGENLAYGYETAEEAVDAWMNSPTHKDNILYAEFTSAAISVYKSSDGLYYWANEFGI